MSKRLAKLLDQPERLIARTISKLETLNGEKSEDVRLLAQNHQNVRQRINDLGLDSDDTTGEELYQALRAKFSKDSILVDKALGLSAGSTTKQRFDKAVALMNALSKKSELWVLKSASAKNLLRQQPPRRLMKLFKYRSVDSLLKRGNINQIYAAMNTVESESWQKKFAKELSRLDGSDYEKRDISFVAFDGKAIDDLKTPVTGVSSNASLGVIGLWPKAEMHNASVLPLALLLVDEFDKLTHDSTTLNLAQIHPALVWWEQSKDLVANSADEVVSFNSKDLALDHLESAAYADRLSLHGQQQLWNGLAAKYKNHVQGLAESLSDLENKAVESSEKAVAPPANLASEYVEAIANEF